tara:strand:+ start:144 stop:461 length:318 start_codon:yes stop_codon:yes gene_type:complete
MNTPYKMKGKSPMMKALIGKQGNLPVELKNKILASPAKGTYENIKAGAKGAAQGAKYGIGAAYRYGKAAYNKSKEEDEKNNKKSPVKMYGKKSPAKNYKKGYYGV